MSRLYNILNKLASQEAISITPKNSSTISGYKVGKIGMVSVTNSGSIPSGTWTTVGNIAEGGRPKSDISTVVTNGGVNAYGKVEITTGGVIRMYHTAGSSQTFYGATFAYPLA